jgi:hypothetical protein
MAPDMIAVRLLRRKGILVPEIHADTYGIPFRGDSAYGLMEDIADMIGVARAVSLRALARDGLMEAFVKSNFDVFCEKLGHAFEVSRKIGLQDRHARNMGVAMMEDGRLEIYMIDLDVVACYPDIMLFQMTYAGQLNSIVQSLDFSNKHGELVRSFPQSVSGIVSKEDKEEVDRRRKAIYWQIGAPFRAGTERAHSQYDGPEEVRRVRRILEEHDGNPVGFKQTPGMLRHNRKTGYAINGRQQDLIDSGPDCGRFKLNWKEAFGKFYENLTTLPEVFWARTLRMAPEKESHAIIY